MVGMRNGLIEKSLHNTIKLKYYDHEISTFTKHKMREKPFHHHKC